MPYDSAAKNKDAQGLLDGWARERFILMAQVVAQPNGENVPAAKARVTELDAAIAKLEQVGKTDTAIEAEYKK